MQIGYWHDVRRYKDPRLLWGIEEFLARGGEFEMTFNRETSSPEEGAEKLKRENPELVALIRRYPDQVKLFWSPGPPKSHYAVSDDEAMVEQPNHGADPPAHLFRRDEKFAQALSERYDRDAAKAVEITSI